MFEVDKTFAKVVVDIIKEDMERAIMPSILLNNSRETAEGKPIVLKHEYGRGRQ